MPTLNAILWGSIPDISASRLMVYFLAQWAVSFLFGVFTFSCFSQKSNDEIISKLRRLVFTKLRTLEIARIQSLDNTINTKIGFLQNFKH
jgi:hypothetical protein